MNKIVIASLALSSAILLASARAGRGAAPATGRQAQWIGVEEKSAPNQWICSRKTLTLEKTPRRAVARIAADSKYWLWVNGKLVVFEGQLKRGPDPQNTYVDRVDLAGSLRKGRNTLAILLWYFGKHGFSHKSSGRAGLVFDADIDGARLVSDRTWKARVHPSYGDTGTPHPNYRLPESNIRFDARKEPVGWHTPGFDDAGWPAAVACGTPPCPPWNRLVARPIPLWKDFGLKEYVNADALPAAGTGGVIKAKLPYNAQVTPWLKIDAPAGKTIDIRTDNYTGGGPPNVRAEYITRAGVQEYENLGWMNGHAVHYRVPAGVRILGLKFRETGYDTAFTGTFSCDDALLNRLRKKAVRTLYITMRDTYFDCPDRERAQWWGDAVNELGEAFYAMDLRSSLLAKKGILELIAWQRKNDTIFSPVPSGNWNKELPMQMLNSVGWYGFHTYCFYSGDVETIRTVYPGVGRYLAVWKQGPDGLVVPRKGDWTWGDWGKNKDMTILYNGWYYLALKGRLETARLLGREDDARAAAAKMKRLAGAFNKTFWNGTAYRSPGYTGKTDDRAHALAVVSGLADPAQYPAIRAVFKKQMHSSPYMEKYVLEALYRMRYPHDAVARIRKRFKPMVESELTTLWEGWGIGKEGYGGGTINHAWSGGALTIMSAYMAGIAPDSLAWNTYHVLPQMGPLRSISANVVTPAGDITLALTREDASFSMDLASPPGTTATAGIPLAGAKAPSSISVNGTEIRRAGKAAGTADGVRFLKTDDHYVLFELAPGRYRLAARYGK